LNRRSGITISEINQAALSQVPVMILSQPKQDSSVARVGEVRSIQSQQAAATAKAQAALDVLLAGCFAQATTV
jgi:hypothetical protein